MSEDVISKYQSRHGFHDRHGAGDYAGIVPALAGDGDGMTLQIYGFLGRDDGGHRFESDPEINIHSI